MSQAFVDTTIWCDALGLSSPDRKAKALSALDQYKLTEAPFYALKELRAGPLAYWILAHNTIVAHNTIQEGFDALSKKTAFKPRNAAVSMAALIQALLNVITAIKNSTEPKLVDEKSELENYLCRYIFKAWQQRRAIVGHVVQPLSCFSDTDLVLDGNLIRFSNDVHDCLRQANCGAAIEIKKHPTEVQAILDALKPPKQTKGAAPEKRETTRRRSALKDVMEKDSKGFPRNSCRALGDAYFCIKAPAASEILTTNLVDFEPMAKAVNKKVATP